MESSVKKTIKKPIISVILPVFNTENYIADAIDSILKQTSPVSEIIVVDDGSTDSTVEVVKNYGSNLKLFCQSNKGAAAARNTGIRNAAGDFLAFLDADDLWIKDKINRQLIEFYTHPELHIVFGYVEQFVSPELDKVTQSRLKAELKQIPGYHVGTMLIKKEAFKKVGFFDEKYQLAEFIDWFSRARNMNLKFSMVNDILMKRRIHETNQGIYKREFEKDYIIALKAAIDRRRKQNPRKVKTSGNQT